MNNSDYDYSTSGFDNFLSRSIDSLDQVNLDSAGPQSNNLRFDGSQISGALGDVFSIGNILLDGRTGRITLKDDDGRVVFVIGELDD